MAAPHLPTPRRAASWVAWALLVVGPALLAVTALSGPRFELVIAGLGLTAGGLLFGLLNAPGVSVVHELPDERR
jgi:hypothetical protein